MSKYCPICQGEFKKGIKVCPTDHIELLSKKDASEKTEILVDIYAAENEIEGERIRAFLADDGIVGQESATGIAQMPVASDNRYVIGVPQSDERKARKLIERARKDKVISTNGSFL